MQVIPLPSDTSARTGFTHLVVLTHPDLTQATLAAAQTIALLNVKAGDSVWRCLVVLKTPFKNSADAAFNTTAAVIGDGGDTARFLASQELNENGTEVIYGVNPAAKAPFVYTVDDTIDIVVSSMAAKALVDLDTGELHVYLGVSRGASLSREIKVA
ncbi:MAG TPA: hypothetical protein VGQ11_02730 [Candidatus Acidoferrales bacterium]|jgi:hypothetical protein|nr:hypothetical protein [Candidatus Acidoferrales bacterium]